MPDFFAVQSRVGQRDGFMAEILSVRAASRVHGRLEAGWEGGTWEESTLKARRLCF